MHFYPYKFKISSGFAACSESLVNEKASDPQAFMLRKLLRCAVAASAGYTVAWQLYNSQRHKPETQADLKETHRLCIWVTEYLCVYPQPTVVLSSRSPPPPGSFFHCDMCKGGNLSLNTSSKQEFSLLFFLIL